MIILKKSNGVKGAIMFTLTFFTFISYLYSLRMKTMTLSEVNMSFKLVWWRATKFQLGDNHTKLVVECICKTLLGWFYSCCGRDRPLSLYIRNYAFETWLVYMLAYLFIIVWFLLKVFEYYGNQKELRKLIEERLWRLRSESSGDSESDLTEYLVQTEFSVRSNDGKALIPNIQISRILHHHDGQNSITGGASGNQKADTSSVHKAKITEVKESRSSSEQLVEAETPAESQASNALCEIFHTTSSTRRAPDSIGKRSTTDTQDSSGQRSKTDTQDSRGQRSTTDTQDSSGKRSTTDTQDSRGKRSTTDTQDSSGKRSTTDTQDSSETCTTDSQESSETCTSSTQDSSGESSDSSQGSKTQLPQTCSNFVPVRYHFSIPRQKRTFSESDIFETRNRNRQTATDSKITDSVQ